LVRISSLSIIKQQKEELMAATQAQIDALEALQNEKVEA